MNEALKRLLGRSGALDLVHLLWRRRLTVLAYHRIADPGAPDFDTYAPNVSATPAAFARQMDVIGERFSVIAMSRLTAWLRGEADLPPRAALITFDDGYRDNLDNALPILRQRGLPATIFLATDHIGAARPFSWDLAAWCFHHATRASADLPCLGPATWNGAQERARTVDRFIGATKRLTEGTRAECLARLPAALGVEVPADAFAGLMMDWDDVRALAGEGLIEFGAHTRRHPILSRLPRAQAEAEIGGSLERIAEEIGRPVDTFAFPNGQPGDFDDGHLAFLGERGVRAAFTLLPGPSGYGAIRRAPFAIRRTMIGYRDGPERFLAKVMGTRRLAAALGRAKPSQ